MTIKIIPLALRGPLTLTRRLRRTIKKFSPVPRQSALTKLKFALRKARSAPRKSSSSTSLSIMSFHVNPALLAAPGGRAMKCQTVSTAAQSKWLLCRPGVDTAAAPSPSGHHPSSRPPLRRRLTSRGRGREGGREEIEMVSR